MKNQKQTMISDKATGSRKESNYSCAGYGIPSSGY